MKRLEPVLKSKIIRLKKYYNVIFCINQLYIPIFILLFGYVGFNAFLKKGSPAQPGHNLYTPLVERANPVPAKGRGITPSDPVRGRRLEG